MRKCLETEIFKRSVFENFRKRKDRIYRLTVWDPKWHNSGKVERIFFKTCGYIGRLWERTIKAKYERHLQVSTESKRASNADVTEGCEDSQS